MLQIYYKPATCIIDGVMDTILAAFIVSASKYKVTFKDNQMLKYYYLYQKFAELKSSPTSSSCHCYRVDGIYYAITIILAKRR